MRASDLRFRSDEIERFLAGMGLSLSEPAIAQLEERAEGWIAGLQPASIAMQAQLEPRSTLSMQGRANPAEFAASPSGSHRYLLSYLTEEVLKAQPAPVRDFLLQTSILSKRNGDLCDAVTGQAGGAA